mgnify:CR=1 FL=1
MAKSNSLSIKLVRGLIGVSKQHRLSVKALGLRKIGDVRVIINNPCTRGLIEKVKYLLETEEVLS